MKENLHILTQEIQDKFTLRIIEPFDTTTEAFYSYLAWLDERLQHFDISPSDLDEHLRISGLDEALFSVRVALKLLQGQRDAEWLSYAGPMTITIVQALYHEVERIAPRSAANPFGEDALCYRLDCFERLHQQFPSIMFRLLVVDDGCDKGSGNTAERLIQQWHFVNPTANTQTKVLFLGKAVEEKSPWLPGGLTNIQQSVKGGAMLYGLTYATHAWPVQGKHILVDADADLSVHPLQTPSLVRPIIEKGVVLAAGSRREPESVRLIGSSRNQRGKLFISVWQHLLPSLAKRVVDTNRGFKAIDAAFVPSLVGSIGEYTFAYQIELLLAASRFGGNAVLAVPICYLDSEALSTQSVQEAQPYLDQVRRIALIGERYGEKSDAGLVRLIHTLCALGKAGEVLWSKLEKTCTTLRELEELARALQTLID